MIVKPSVADSFKQWLKWGGISRDHRSLSSEYLICAILSRSRASPCPRVLRWSTGRWTLSPSMGRPTSPRCMAPPLGGNDGRWIGPTQARVLRSLALDAWPVRSFCAFPGAPIARRSDNPQRRRVLVGRARPFLLVWLKPPRVVVVGVWLLWLCVVRLLVRFAVRFGLVWF